MSTEQAQKAIENIFQVIEPGGSVYLVGNIVDDTRLFPPAAIAFSPFFLNAYDKGGAYTHTQYQNWMEAAGFVDVAVQYEAMADRLGIVSARKPFNS